jgi:hypothetical protein
MLLYYIIHFLASTLLNSFLEVQIFHTLRKELKKKERIVSSLNEEALNAKKKFNDEARRKALHMIAVNGLLNFVLRSP